MHGCVGERLMQARPQDAERRRAIRPERPRWPVAHHHVAVTVDDVDRVEPVADLEAWVGEVEFTERSQRVAEQADAGAGPFLGSVGLDDIDLDALAGKADGGGQAGYAGTDHDDTHVSGHLSPGGIVRRSSPGRCRPAVQPGRR